MSKSTTQETGIEAIEQRREAIERAAETDLPVAKWAEALLEVADE